MLRRTGVRGDHARLRARAPIVILLRAICLAPRTSILFSIRVLLGFPLPAVSSRTPISVHCHHNTFKYEFHFYPMMFGHAELRKGVPQSRLKETEKKYLPIRRQTQASVYEFNLVLVYEQIQMGRMGT